METVTDFDISGLDFSGLSNISKTSLGDPERMCICTGSIDIEKLGIEAETED